MSTNAGQQDRLLTYDQLARALQISPGTLRNWVSQDYIPHVKLGRCVRFNSDDINNWLKQRSCPGRLQLIPDNVRM